MSKEAAQKIKNRIINLVNMAQDDGDILSEPSLAAVVKFAEKWSGKYPSITVCDNGVFHLSWRHSKKEKIISELNSVGNVHYIIFAPNGDDRNHSILDKSLSDFVEHISSLHYTLEASDE